MDGFEVARRMREDARFQSTSVLMLTSAGLRGDAAHCKQLGLDAYITKPLTLSELREAMSAALGHLADSRLITRHSLREARAKYRVLLAEDNPVNQKLAVKLLEKQGHQVSVADNGRLALDAWRTGQFDLVLMDMMMPEMDGLDATAHIREEEKARGGHIVIIAMTANAMQGDRERCLQAGMDGYVSKPVKPDTLYQEIERAMRGSPPGDAMQPGAEEDALPVYDRAEALSRIADDEELLNQLLEMFVSDAPTYLAEIDASLAGEDVPRLIRASHTIKGVLATFSARRSENLARRMEHAAREGDIAQVRALLPDLKVEVERFLAVLRQA
jgi:CheY-like chemotaxis protein/HPt (histidine-containing phosphotransfer) domain-containing protein